MLQGCRQVTYSMFLLMESDTAGFEVFGLRRAALGESGSRLPSNCGGGFDLEEVWDLAAEAEDLRDCVALPEEEVAPEEEPA